MKVAALKRLRKKLAADEATYGLWVTLESATITEMAVALGLDWVVIDAEHGHLDWHNILEHIRTTVRSDTVCLVRIAENNISLFKRVLDIGADGVVVPWMETADQLRDALSYAWYPPQGVRGIGGERATCWGNCFVENAETANENVMVVPIIESVRGGKNIHELVAVEGSEMFFFGPADFSSSAGYPGQWEGPGVAEQIIAAKDVIRGAGKHCGVVVTGLPDLHARFDQGFRLLGLGMDGPLFVRSLQAMLTPLGRDQPIRASFTVENDPDAVAAEVPVACAPPDFRPDRNEVMNERGSGPQIEIEPGVMFDCMIGAHNQARNLTTGVVTIDPQAKLPYHKHTFAESLTLLSGEGVVEVEGRMYDMALLDNVTIPRGLAHSTRNPSRNTDAVFQIVMASDHPDREYVDTFFSRRQMPRRSSLQPGGERYTHVADAERYAPGPNTSFIDFFNAELIPGLEMSGGYGEFGHGGRLPAHLHDFDESICIPTGEAKCVVEGKSYQLGNLATALQPRGRIHYFINETSKPMTMLWAYAGPMPERIVVDGRCADEPGVAWD